MLACLFDVRGQRIYQEYGILWRDGGPNDPLWPSSDPAGILLFLLIFYTCKCSDWHCYHQLLYRLGACCCLLHHEHSRQDQRCKRKHPPTFIAASRHSSLVGLYLHSLSSRLEQMYLMTRGQCLI